MTSGLSDVRVAYCTLAEVELVQDMSQRKNFSIFSSDSRRIRVTLFDRDGNVIDASSIAAADFALDLKEGRLTKRFGSEVYLGANFPDEKARVDVHVLLGDTRGKASQVAAYQFAIAFGDDRDSVLHGDFHIKQSLIEPASTENPSVTAPEDGDDAADIYAGVQIEEEELL